MSKRILYCGFLILVLCLAGCAGKEKHGEKISDLEYTVLREEEIPEALKKQIDQKRESRFKLTYKTEDYLYIASGYGAQETGGYSICMKNLYRTKNAIYFKTELTGPRKGENVNKGMSFPYIVIKLEKREEPVVFE